MVATAAIEKALAYLEQNKSRFMDELFDFLRIESISAQKEHEADNRTCAEWVKKRFEAAGLKADIEPTAGWPAVIAMGEQKPGRPTLLFYGHYDVQPEGDLNLWHTGPFKPVVKDGMIVCRGSADDKGQVLLYVRAAAAWLATEKKLPINLKLLIEGEEEIGSPNLPKFVQDHKALLKCDGILISDTGMHEDGLPTITYGTRGLAYKEVILHGPKFNLHSGTHGGPVTNPANALAQLIASFHDAAGRVNIPGFYDDVVDLTPQERKAAAALPMDERKYAEELGVPGFSGEKGYTVTELRAMRPTLDVNGIYGGYMDKGANTIIPATAGAKVSMRLVPNQRGDDIGAKFEKAVRERVPKTVRCEILDHSCADAYVTPLHWSAMKAAARALREAFDREPVFIREGGSLPILPMFERHLGAKCLMLGFASPSCNAHGPNEKAYLPDLDRGAEAVARLFAHLAT